VDPRAAIVEILRDSVRTLIVCHVNPDGDCLGAGLALVAALRRLGVTATMASADGVPASLSFLSGTDGVVTAVADEGNFPVAVTIECTSLDRAGRLAPAVQQARTIIAIDHHQDPPPYAHVTDWDPRAAAVGEQVADIITRLGVEIDRPIAQNLLAALVTDTGVFRYSNTTPRSLRLAATLMERGATIHEIVRAVYEDQPASSLRLLGRALAGLTLHAGGAVAATVVTQAMLAEAGARWEETSGIAAALRTITGVRLALVFEERDGSMRVSIRSRGEARADRIAQALGGGGHPAAAGADVVGAPDETVARVLALAAREVAGTGDDA